MKKKIRHFLSVGEFSLSELKFILKRAMVYKKNRKRLSKSLHHKTIGLLFEKVSTRTRVSFEVGIQEMGGGSIFLNIQTSQMGRGESLLDTLRVMERYLNGMIIRNHNHKGLWEASQTIKIPIINGLSESHHPCQAIADALTIWEKIKKKSPRIVYVGEGNNVASSLIEVCSLLHWPLTVASPKNYNLPYQLRKNIVFDEKYITLTEDVEQAVNGADVIYTDTWYSMNDKKSKKNFDRKKALIPYQVNSQLIKSASPGYIFLHCLPAYRGEEVTDEILDGSHSQVWNQAENRLHVQKALMEFFFFS